MQSCIFSIITPVFGVTWSSEIIIIYWFAAQKLFLSIINVENSRAAQYFCVNWCIKFVRIDWWIERTALICDVSSAVNCVTCWIVSVWSLRAWWRGRGSSLIDRTFIATRYVLMKGKCTHWHDLYNTSVWLMWALLYNSFIPQKRHTLKGQEIN